jgi:ATP-dependent DNA helicase RecG
MASNGSPSPQFDSDDDRTYYLVRLPIHARAKIQTEQVTEQVDSLLNVLINAELGTRDLMKSLDLKHRPTFVYDYLQPSLHNELVEMTQPDSPNSPTQKYRLTQKGRKTVGSE